MPSNPEHANGNHYMQENVQRNRAFIQSLKTRQDKKRSRAEKVADWITSAFGSVGFLVLNVLWFVVWIGTNLKIVPGIGAFDPFPFGLLTMIVSLEAIVLAIFVLISQNRSSKIAELRKEVDLQVDMIAERELTKLLHLVSALAEKQGINIADDEELQAMLEPTSVKKIERALEKQVIGAAPSAKHKAS